MTQESPIRIFTWHIHGSYLYYLSRCNVELYIPFDAQRSDRYIGLGTTFPFGENVKEIAAEEVRNASFDCVLFQSPENYREDQHRILSEQQRKLPRLYLEHNPPQENPVFNHHFVRDPEVTIVHVTHFNKLMWDNNGVPSVVIDHGIPAPTATYTGELSRGIVVINNLSQRGRRLGSDIFEAVRKRVPIDLVGMGTENMGGLGEVLHPELPEFLKRYRFFFNPIRYTSLGLAVLEAMMVGLPVVGLATTEMATVFSNGHSGWIHTDVDYLVDRMQELLNDREAAARMGLAGREIARERFSLERFARDWDQLLHRIVSEASARERTRVEQQADAGVPEPAG
jgi:glycosyltransferase involved in cell wall biosynthesis